MEELYLDPHVNFEKKSRSLSETLYGLVWSNYLPRNFGEYELRKGNSESLFRFVKENHREIFGDDKTQLVSEPIELKKNYYNYCTDIFEFTYKGEVVGIATCNPADWCSYYIRYIAIKKEHQGRGLQRRWVEFLSNILCQANVERIEIEISPANFAQLSSCQKMGFYFIGSTTSERWGVILKYVKFLNASRRDVYVDQFCQGIKTRA